MLKLTSDDGMYYIFLATSGTIAALTCHGVYKSLKKREYLEASKDLLQSAVIICGVNAIYWASRDENQASLANYHATVIEVIEPLFKGGYNFFCEFQAAVCPKPSLSRLLSPGIFDSICNDFRRFCGSPF